MQKKARGRNAWEILLSAPNEKWLNWELDRICNSELRNVSLEDRGSILDRYCINRLMIISTEGRQIAQDWVTAQTRPGSDAIDWDFMDAGSWDAEANNNIDTLFLLDKQKLTDKSANVIKSLPKESQAWLEKNAEGPEGTVAKETIQTESGSKHITYAIIEPSARHLRATLTRFNSLGSIPESLISHRLWDLGKYGRMVIVVRSGDRTQEIDKSIINDLGGKLSSVLSTSGTGFECISRQDLKELVFNSISNAGDNDKIDSSKLLQIQKAVGRDCALVVADLTAVGSTTSYVANSPTCLSQRYAEFSKPKPTEPSKPDPEEFILILGKKYRLVNGDRKNDPHYINDLRDYENSQLPNYRRELRSWEDERDNYEASRRYHDMEWSRSVDAVQSAKISGNLRIYDAGNLGTESAGQLIFSCSLSGNSEDRSLYKSDKVSVRGEDSMPDSLDAPQSQDNIKDLTLVSNAILEACKSSVEEMKRTSVLPSDMLNVKKPSLALQPEHLSVEAVGTVIMKKKPSDSELKDIHGAALEDSYSKLILDIKSVYPTANLTVDDIKDKVTIISEGWNAKSGEYRIKVRFDGDIMIEEAQAEAKK